MIVQSSSPPVSHTAGERVAGRQTLPLVCEMHRDRCFANMILLTLAELLRYNTWVSDLHFCNARGLTDTFIHQVKQKTGLLRIAAGSCDKPRDQRITTQLLQILI